MFNYLLFMFMLLLCFDSNAFLQRCKLTSQYMKKHHTRNHLSEDGINDADDADQQGDDFSSNELAELNGMLNGNKEEWQAMLKDKLNRWSELKNSGELSKLSLAEDLGQAIDELDKRIPLISRGLTVKSPAAPLVPEPITGKLYQLQEKLKKVQKSLIGLYALLNEIKDKKAADRSLLEDVMMSVSRVNADPESQGTIENAFGLFCKLELECPYKESNPSTFYLKFVDSLYVNGNIAAARAIKNTLLQLETSSRMNNNSKTSITQDDFFVGEVIASIGESPESFENMFDELKKNVKTLSVSQINSIIRVLGRQRKISKIFEVLQIIRKADIRPNDETLEFMSNSLVLSVEESAKAKTMTDLPKPKNDMPEVVFIGRSNVGKSSLVNMICNRKTLASTSATPGHTKQFHFFSVNGGRKDISSFYLIDVPGFGYAEVEENKMDSWRNLIERYLAVRQPLKIVFHLIDSRLATLADIDLAAISLVAKALEVRRSSDLPSFLYTIVLTKVDKAKEKEVNAVEKTIRELFTASGSILADDIKFAKSVQIIRTSSVSREGRDIVWELLGKQIYLPPQV